MAIIPVTGRSSSIAGADGVASGLQAGEGYNIVFSTLDPFHEVLGGFMGNTLLNPKAIVCCGEEPYGWFRYRLEDLLYDDIMKLSSVGDLFMMITQSELHLRKIYEIGKSESGHEEMRILKGDPDKLSYFWWEAQHDFFDTTTFAMSLSEYDSKALESAYHYTNFDVGDAERQIIALILNGGRRLSS